MSLRLVTVLLAALIVLVGALPVSAWQLHGFVDARSGLRLHNAAGQRRAILNETRLQLDLSHDSDWAQWRLRGDVVADEAAGAHDFDLELGHGVLDMREANVLLYPLDCLDVKIGRQILTWGTGDLLFINDMFPKDWQSFFLGRDEEYLKAPSDAVLASFYFDSANLDVVYTPQFDSDRYISGERLSYWNPMLGRHAVRSDGLRVDRRNRAFSEDEFSVRLYRDVKGYELALYGYSGYWKNPVGFDAASGRQSFPRLDVYGASGRGGLFGGIFNIEGGFYNSRDDRGGDDPNVPNSEYRLLLGYEHELARDFSAAGQYYLEYLDHYGNYRAALPAAVHARERCRHVFTLRLTRQALSQNLTLSLFCYWSPSDEDGYLRPIVKYKASDAVSIYVGGNLFLGRRCDTFFGQFEDNNNLYLGARYSF